MRTIAIINQKGGCGKTTVAINLAAVLAAQGRRTLLVDMDPQAHCALGLAVPEAQIDRSVSDLLRAGLDGTLAFGDVTWQIARNLDLAPSTMQLATLEPVLASAPDKDRRLAQVLATVQDTYEFCVIDCPPSIGLLTFNALRAADEVLIPVETGYFSMQGAIKQQATIDMLARRANHRARFMVLATMYDVRTKLAREILAELRRHFGTRLLPVVVNFNSKLKEAASFGQAITEYDPTSRGMADFDKLAAWLVENPPAGSALQPAHADTLAGSASDTAAYRPDASAPASLDEPRASAPDSALADALIGHAPHDPAASAGYGHHLAANPALSRAAELVERARALSRRTAALAARLGADPDLRAERPLLETPDHHAPDPTAPSDPAAPSAMIAPAGVIASAITAHPNAQPHNAPSAPLGPDHPAPPQRTAPLQHTPSDDDAFPPGRARQLHHKLARLYGVRNTASGVLFVQPASIAKNAISVAGEFNNWSAHATPMARNQDLGVWEACVPVRPGRYRYRLVIDGQWVQDPHNGLVEANPFGELNSVIEVA